MRSKGVKLVEADKNMTNGFTSVGAQYNNVEGSEGFTSLAGFASDTFGNESKNASGHVGVPAIDSHCHIYPEKIASRAIDGVGNFYGIPMDCTGGTADALVADSAGAPIVGHIVHSVATRADQVESINNFIAAACQAHPQYTGFMTLHQDMADPAAEIERACKLGLKGVKLHPDTQRVNMDDPRLMRIYEIIEGRLPLIMHCGDYRYDFSHPRRMKAVLRAFPGLVVDAAHFGGWSIFDVAVEFLEHERCYMDISSSMEFIGDRRTRELVEIYGPERIMFGSDYPMWSPVAEYNRFAALGFDEAALKKMMLTNAQRFIAGKFPENSEGVTGE
jgi:hypothetical protein